MNFLEIKEDDLNNIDMNPLSEKITSDEQKKYFLEKASQEHYRLLSYISLNNNGVKILDVGTYKGCSALAFSINPTNTIYSFDVAWFLDLKDYNNFTFINDNVMLEKYKSLIISCPYILLDTLHDGKFEKSFYDYLKNINYKGCLLLDDIKLNKEMVDFWNSINDEKYDISHIGHITGTGVIKFK